MDSRSGKFIMSEEEKEELSKTGMDDSMIAALDSVLAKTISGEEGAHKFALSQGLGDGGTGVILELLLMAITNSMSLGWKGLLRNLGKNPSGTGKNLYQGAKFLDKHLKKTAKGKKPLGKLKSTHKAAKILDNYLYRPSEASSASTFFSADHTSAIDTLDTLPPVGPAFNRVSDYRLSEQIYKKYFRKLSGNDFYHIQEAAKFYKAQAQYDSLDAISAQDAARNFSPAPAFKLRDTGAYDIPQPTPVNYSQYGRIASPAGIGSPNPGSPASVSSSGSDLSVSGISGINPIFNFAPNSGGNQNNGQNYIQQMLEGIAKVETRHKRMIEGMLGGNRDLTSQTKELFARMTGQFGKMFGVTNKRHQKLIGSVLGGLSNYVSTLSSVSSAVSKAFSAFGSLNPFAALAASIVLSQLSSRLGGQAGSGGFPGGSISGGSIAAGGSVSAAGSGAGGEALPQVIIIHTNGEVDLDRALDRAGLDRTLRQRIYELQRTGGSLGLER